MNNIDTDNIDADNIDTLISKFQNNIKSHPNISKIWIETLELLKNKNKILTSKALYALSLVDKGVNDIDIHDIIIVSIYLKSLESLEETLEESIEE